MNIPEKIKIGAHDITIKKVDVKELNCLGDYNDWFKIIRINVEGSLESTQAECILHEIFEAVDKMYGLELEHSKLTVLSEALFQTIRDNDLDFRREK